MIPGIVGMILGPVGENVARHSKRQVMIPGPNPIFVNTSPTADRQYSTAPAFVNEQS